VVREARKALPKGSLAIEAIKHLAESPFVAGYYIRIKPKTIALSMYKRAKGFRQLVHEFTHHVLEPHRRILARAVRGDLPEIDKLVVKLWESGDEKLVKVSDWVARDTIRFACEYATEYVTSNYFVLLNTKPVARSRQLVGLDLFDSMVFATITADLTEVLERLWVLREERRGLPREEEEELTNLCDVLRANISDEDALPRYISTLHSIFSRAIKAWPKDVYLSDPRRYELLFRDVNWEELRRKGIPVME